MIFQASQQIKLRADKKLATTTYVNEVADAFNGLLGIPPHGQKQPSFSGPDPYTTVVIVQNNSGANIPRFGVLGIDSPIIFPPSLNLDSFDSRVAFNGVTPVIADHTGKFLIAEHAIPIGGRGYATLAGVCWAFVEITASGDTNADVKASSAELKTGTTGAAQILWKESGTGTGKLAVIRFGGGGGSGGGGEQLWVWIDSARSAPGMYKAYFATINVFPATVDTTAIDSFNSDEDDGGPGDQSFFSHDTGAEELTAVNLFEAQFTGHAIAAEPQTNLVFACWLSGAVDNNGKRVVFFFGINPRYNCNTGVP